MRVSLLVLISLLPLFANGCALKSLPMISKDEPIKYKIEEDAKKLYKDTVVQKRKLDKKSV